MEIRLSKNAVKTLEKMDKRYRRHIKEGIEGIPAGDIQPMQGLPAGRYRLRVGGYRVIFGYDGNTLIVYEIGSRGDVYK